MEAPTSPKSPRQQTEFAPVGLHGNDHDIELQSPVRGSFIIDEKTMAGFPSPPESSDGGQVNNRVSYLGAGRPTPVRKYSREWWQRSWTGAIRHKTWPRLLYVTFGLLCISLWIGLTVFFANEQIRWDRGDEQPFEERVAQAAHDKDVGDHLISLSGSLKSFDPVARNLHIEWTGLFQETIDTPASPLANGTFPNTYWPLDIYRDLSTVLYDQADNSTTRNSSEVSYWFRVDNGTAPRIGAIGIHRWDSFETDISFGQNAETADAFSQPSFSYPYDEWKGSVVFVASFNVPGFSTVSTLQGNYTGASVQPLAGARLEDNTLNWRFMLSFENPCSTDPTFVQERIRSFAGPDATMSEYLANDALLAQVNIPCHLSIEITALRPPLVRFAAVMAVIVNWTSTIFIFVLTCECLIMRRGFMMAGTDLLGITFTALFALPSVRLLLPGAPDFGALIDLIGIIPNVLIISICIIAIAITKLNRRRHPDQKDE